MIYIFDLQPGTKFKRVRGIWWANWKTVALCHKDLSTLAEMVADAQEKGYE